MGIKKGRALFLWKVHFSFAQVFCIYIYSNLSLFLYGILSHYFFLCPLFLWV